ncbi:MAG: hypothetical protein R3F59_23905 [Myxococcota bacterium]
MATCPRCGAEHQLQVRLLNDHDGEPDPPLPSSALDPAPARAIAEVRARTPVPTAEVEFVDSGVWSPIPEPPPPPGEVQVDGEPVAIAPPPKARKKRRPRGDPFAAALHVRLGDALERVRAAGVQQWAREHLVVPAFPPGMPSPATALQVREDGDALQLEWGWFGLPAVILAMGTAVFAVGIAGWGAAAVLLSGSWLGWLAAGGATVHALATVIASYVASAGLVDRTRVRATPSALDVWHGPVPWPGPRRIGAAQIAAIEVVPRQVRGRAQPVTLYDVVVVLRGEPARRVPVARGAFSREAAQGVADQLQRRALSGQPAGEAKRRAPG